MFGSRFVGALAIVLAGTAAASANQIVQTETYGPTATNWGTGDSTSPGFTPSQALAFAGFDPALGTLTSVNLLVTEVASGTVNITNNGTSSSGETAYLTNILEASVPGLATVTVTDYSSSYSDTLASGASSGSHSVSGTANSGTLTVSDAPDLATYSSDWNAFLGDLGSSSVSSTNGDGSAVYTDLGEGEVQVTYFYTPTVTVPAPEPAAIAVLGVGLIGVGIARRRRC